MQNQEIRGAKRSSKFKWVNWAIIGITMIVAVIYILVVDRPENIIAAIRSIKLYWLGIAGIMMLLYWLLESCVLHAVTKKLYHPQKFMDTVRTTMVGQFYNCITPFASGGQPMQAYSMVKTGVPLGIAGSSLLMRFIVYQFSLTLYSLITLIIFWNFFASRVTGLAFLSAIGFAINSLVMAGLFCIGFARGFAKKITVGTIRLLAKMHLMKHPDEKIIAAEIELDKFYEGFQLARKNAVVMAEMFLLSLLQLTVFFLIPYFLCLAFGQTHVSLFQVVAAQAFVTMVTSFVPLPGAAGGAEISFVTFFAIFMRGSNLNLSMLLWRMLTFYAPILIGGIVALGCSNETEAYMLNKCEMEAQKKKLLEKADCAEKSKVS